MCAQTLIPKQIKTRWWLNLKHLNESFIANRVETAPWHDLCQWSAKENHRHRRLFANSIYLPENLIPKLCSRAGFSNCRKQNYKTAARSGRLAAADITQHCWRIAKKTFSAVWLQNWWNMFRVSRLKNWFIFLVDRRGFVELHQGFYLILASWFHCQYSTLFSITNLILTTQKQGKSSLFIGCNHSLGKGQTTTQQHLYVTQHLQQGPRQVTKWFETNASVVQEGTKLPMRGADTQFNATHKVCRSKACLMLCSLLEVFLSTAAHVFTVHRFPACGKSERWVNSASWFHWISGSISLHQRQKVWQAHFQRAAGNVRLLLWLFKVFNKAFQVH